MHCSDGHRFIWYGRLGCCTLDIASGTWYIDCIDASEWTVGSTGATLFLQLIFSWSLKALRLAPMTVHRIFRQPLDAPMLRHRLNQCPYFLPNSSNASQRSIGSFKFILPLDFHYALTSLRRIGLVILMVDWTWRLDDRLDIASWRWIRHVDSYPWDLITPTSVIS